MKRTESSLSLPQPSSRHGILRVPVCRLRPHPANANVMEEDRLEKLAENIRRQRDYPPLVVRPHPEEKGAFQLLDGHQRAEVLRRLRWREAHCYVWPCDDQSALVLLATLNRLEGQDDPMKRAELLERLTQMSSPEELARLLPEDANSISSSLGLLNSDLEDLLADLEKESGTGTGLRAITFAVSPEDEPAIEAAVGQVATTLKGTNRRGRALALIARAFLKKETT